MKEVQDVVGLIPAAGGARRSVPLPCSKEIYPIGFTGMGDGDRQAPKAVCHYLLEKMCRAGIKRAYVVLRKGKWDIPAYLCQDTILEMEFAYLVVDSTSGVPYTIDQAYPFLKNSVVAFGFPDIVFHENNVFERLLNHQKEAGCHVVLGLFPVDNPTKVDMVDLAESGAVRDIIAKPLKTNLTYTWALAVWSPVFTQLMHEILDGNGTDSPDREFFVGDVLRQAIKAGLRVEGVCVSDEPFIDIGTPVDLLRAVRRASGTTSLSLWSETQEVGTVEN